MGWHLGQDKDDRKGTMALTIRKNKTGGGIMGTDGVARVAADASRVSGSGNSVAVQGNAIVRLAFNVLMVIVLALGVCAACGFGFDAAGGGEVAVAEEFDSGAGYADSLLDSNGMEGWKADLIENADPDSKLDPGAHGENLLDGINTFLLSLSTIIIVLSIVVAAGRFAGRALLQLLYGQPGSTVNFNSTGKNTEEHSDFWIVFMTSSERNSKQLESEWVRVMAKETFLLLGIGIFAGFIVGLLAGVGQFIISQITDTAAQTGVGTLDVGSIHVETK